ncbi:MAG: ATP synthase F1 subunit gamma, partial [Clostridia bacterium]|nr:ATP synthase F1 subunit gamma [Clostridia bacterium]
AGNMKAIKLRIKSVKGPSQITRARELVASSKLVRAKERVLKSRPYYETLYATLKDIVAGAEDFSSPFLTERPVKRAAYIVIAGDRGLAGGYNANVLKLADELIKKDDAEGISAVALPIGKKALEYFEKRERAIYSRAFFQAEALKVSGCFSMAKDMCRAYEDGEIDRITLCYTHFDSMLSQSPRSLELLPLTLDAEPDGRRQTQLYDTDARSLFAAIVPEYVGGIIYGALCESVVSEQGARRAAMEAAGKNAQEMIEQLNLKYNRARQGAITQEITEIVAGAES